MRFKLILTGNTYGIGPMKRPPTPMEKAIGIGWQEVSGKIFTDGDIVRADSLIFCGMSDCKDRKTCSCLIISGIKYCSRFFHAVEEKEFRNIEL